MRTEAVRLAQRFSDAIGGFLLDNGMPTNGDDYVQWLEDLNIVFTKALQLRAQMLLRKDGMMFGWPRYGRPFDPAIMRAENEERRGAGTTNVQLSLFPSLTQKLGWQERREDHGVQTVLHAVVILQ